eukprot:m51a1_g5629 putative sh2 domain-containing protein (623) ;mRNA; r:802416-804745
MDSETEIENLKNDLIELQNVDELSPMNVVQGALASLYRKERRLQDLVDKLKHTASPADTIASAEKVLEMVVENVARLLEVSAQMAGSAANSTENRQQQQQQPQQGLGTADPAQRAQVPASPQHYTAQQLHGAPLPPPALVLEGPPEIPPEELTYDRVRDRLGGGTSADVYRAICRGKHVAVKVPRNQDLSERQLKSFRHEVTINKKIFHPNVVLFLGACTRPRNLFIVSELMSCDLERLISGPTWPGVPILTRLRMAHDAALGINWLHGICQIIHRDLKPANLMLDENMRVKVSDFGFSEVLRGGHARDQRGAKGTALYMAPEIMQMEEFDQSADVYSFGLILWEMLSGRAPFSHIDTLDALFQAVCVDNERPPPLTNVLPEVMAIIERCWSRNPADRGGFPRVITDLENVIVDTAIADSSAREFWRRRFAHPLQESVQWETFKSVVAEEVNCSPINLEALASLVGVSTTAALGDAGRTVSIERFGLFASWFGAFFEPEHGLQLIREMAALVDKRWFHADTKQEDAESRLRGRPERTFLVRLSSTDPVKSPFTVSKIAGGKYVHQRVKRVAVDPNSALRYEFHSTAGTIQAATLDELVMRLKGIGSVTMDCPQEPLRRDVYY